MSLKQRFNNLLPGVACSVSKGFWPMINCAVVGTGEYIQTWTNTAGDFIAPRFLRHHLTDLDGYMYAYILDAAQLSLCALFNKKAISRPLACATVVFALGIGNELHDARQPGRHFDFVDTACHGVTAALYVLQSTKLKKKEEYWLNVLKNTTPAVS